MNQGGQLLPKLTEDLRLVAVPAGWSLPWFGYLIIMALLAAFLLPLYFALRKKSVAKAARAAEPDSDPARTALERLARLRQILGQQTPHQSALEASSILRDYAEDRFCIRAPYQTTREFLLHAEHTSSFPRDDSGSVQAILAACDRIKFAGSTASTATFEDFLDYLEQFIGQTRLRQVANPPHD